MGAVVVSLQACPCSSLWYINLLEVPVQLTVSSLHKIQFSEFSITFIVSDCGIRPRQVERPDHVLVPVLRCDVK